MNQANFNKTIISCAISAALGFSCGPAASDTITKLKIEDVGSNTANAANSFSATLDGRSGAFRFNNIDLTTYLGASLFTGDVGLGEVLLQGAANPTGSFSTGFLFTGTPFVPFTFGNNANGTISIDANGNYTLNISSLDWGGNFGGTQDFLLQPDAGSLRNNWLISNNDGTFKTNFQWLHDITTAEDPSLSFTSFTARWVLEGTLSVSDAAPTIFPNSGAAQTSAGVAYTDPGAVCADVVDGLITANIVTTYEPVGTTAPANPQADFEVVYNCTDNTAGLPAIEVRRPITVVAGPDTTPPTITLNACTTSAGVDCSSDGSANTNTVNVLVDANYTDALGTCTDNVDGSISLSNTGQTADPTFFSNPVDPNSPPLDTSAPISTAIDFTCRDSIGNPSTVSRTVNVVADNVAPTIDLGTQQLNVVISLGSTAPDLSLGITCLDTNQIDGPGSVTDITPNLVINPASVDTNTVGTTQVTYTCADATGNNATPLIRTFDVVAGQNFRILSMTISDYNNDGLAGCFRFGTIDPNTCTGANRFSSDGSAADPNAGTPSATISGTGTDLDVNNNPIGVRFGSYQNVGEISPGFLFLNFPFVPFTFDPPSESAPAPEGFIVDAGATKLVKMTSFPFSGRYSSNTPNDFFLDPDDGTFATIDVVPVAGPPAIPNTLEFQYRVAWSHVITATEDPTGQFVNNQANWLLEGVITTENTPSILNDAPIIDSVTASQGAFAVTQIIPKNGGMVTVTANATDPNAGDTVSYLWTGPAGITGQTTPSVMFDPSILPTGNISINITATDDAASPLSASEDLVLQIVSTPPDPDYGDDDNDLIPNYLDSVDGNITPATNSIAPGDPANIVSDGGQIRLGSFALGTASGSFLVTEADVGVQDRVNRIAGLGHSGGGIYDFEVSGLTPGGTARVVLPQAVPLPAISIYRKYTVGKDWFTFSATGGNQLASAMSVGGVCPDPTDNVAYDDALGLVGGHDCVRLTIVDGSAMDADGIANGKVRDPGTVSNNGAADPGSGVSSGCSMATSQSAGAIKHAEWGLLAAFMALLGWRRKKNLQ